MLKIKTFSFNPFQVNTYLLYDDTLECIIIDPACYGSSEEQQLKEFIDSNNLKVKHLLNTHCHIDHILGNNFISKTYNVGLGIHKAGESFLLGAKDYGVSFGFTIDDPIKPAYFIEDEQLIKFGNHELKVLYTPGHADGSVCFYNEKEQFVIVGDVLFNSSIGRTDLPTGNYDLLVDSIKNKLWILPDHVKVLCGHGPDTTIGFEKDNNPYVAV